MNELKHRKCVFCGLVDIINAKWYKTNEGFMCKYCYEEKRTYLKINTSTKEKMVEDQNRCIKNWLPRRYLNYYGNYLFGEIIELNHLENEYDEGRNKNEMHL